MEVEQSTAMLSKKVWNLVKILLLMLRKGIPKTKLMLDFQLVLKRGKIALRGLMLHHHHHHNHFSFAGAAFGRRTSRQPHLPFLSPGNRHYEFSCSNSPNYTSFLPNRRNKLGPTGDGSTAVNASPLVLLPGFGRSPTVRQLRVTDSPFPLRDGEDDATVAQVNKAAEEFIEKFYKDLKLQTTTSPAFESPYYDLWN